MLSMSSSTNRAADHQREFRRPEDIHLINREGKPDYRLSSYLKKNIRERYRDECAYCGVTGKLTTDVAHLYEDASKRMATADRLIILCSNCNQAEARAHGRSTPPLADVFEAESVSAKAIQSYREGNYRRAYAAHRLAAYLFERHGQYSKALGNLTAAISALRPIRWGDFIASTLLECERLCLSYAIGIVQRWLCINRCSLVLYDYRRWEESAQVETASQLLIAGFTDDQRNPEEFEFDRMNSFRRQVLITAFTARLGVRPLWKLIDRLREDSKQFLRHSQFDSFATNLDVARKLALEISANAEKAHEFSEETLEKSAKIRHKWVLQEHYWSEVDYYLGKRDRPRMRKNLLEALRIFRDHPVVLEPTLGAAGPVPHDPIAEIERYGITVEELRDRGVAPPSNTPQEIELALDKSRLRNVVKSVLDGQSGRRKPRS